MRHIVALSGGKDSTAMAIWLAENEPRDYEFICTPTGDEPDEMFAHWRKLGQLLGRAITPVTYRTGLSGLIREQNALPNWRQRWCTRILKIEPYAAFLMTAAPCVSYVGLRADEETRQGGDYLDVPGVTMDFPLRRAGMGLADVLALLAAQDIIIPKRTDCRRCFYQRLIEWYEFWNEDREGWLSAEAEETATGYTFRSPGRDTQPTALRDLRAKFETGWIPRDTRRGDAMQCAVCRR